MSKLPRYVVVEKKVGETPLAALELFRKREPRLAGSPITYAGRLDPMASGQLVLLIGDECKQRDTYTSFDKAYEFEILLGAGTDTGDVLGLPRLSDGVIVSDEEIENVLHSVLGHTRSPYPAFSSKTIEGKPLFEYTLEGSLDTVEIPQKDSYIYRLTYLGKREISSSNLLEEIEKKITSLKIDTESTKLGADFRRGEILERWKLLLKDSRATFSIISCEATVSSGTYIRTLADVIAQKLGTTGLAYSIHRTKIGTFRRFFKRFGLWTKVL
ncbi:MAG: hypothetical protein AAB458_00020 [Patescibacteria group bacterium]